MKPISLTTADEFTMTKDLFEDEPFDIEIYVFLSEGFAILQFRFW
jgi:hypothetical protein